MLIIGVIDTVIVLTVYILIVRVLDLYVKKFTSFLLKFSTKLSLIFHREQILKKLHV